jgi:hypothetical protein
MELSSQLDTLATLVTQKTTPYPLNKKVGEQSTKPVQAFWRIENLLLTPRSNSSLVQPVVYSLN